MYGMPLNETGLLAKMIRTVANLKINDQQFSKRVSKAIDVSPNFWHGDITIACDIGKTANDTFLRLDGWTKGIAFINGYNLGRYWPAMGPQVRNANSQKLQIIRLIISKINIREDN